MTFFLTFSYEPQFYIEFPDRVFKKIKHKNSWLQYNFI
jgi:hypothetical protein